MTRNQARYGLLMIALFGLILVGAWGCHSARMAVPGDLKDSGQMMTCKGRGGFDETFDLGSYRVHEVKRGWTKRTAWGFLIWEKSSASQKYEFSLTGSDDAVWNGQAITNLNQKDLKSEAWGGELQIGLSSEQNLVVRFGKQDVKAGWTMVLMKNKDNVLEGLLGNGSIVYSIDGTKKLAGSPMPLGDASGYIITRNGRNVCAVEVINEGAVWFAPSLTSDERDLLAAAATGLLLFKDLEE